MKEIEQFIIKVFNFIDPKNLPPNTLFKDLPSWNSLNALIIHSNIEEYYNVKLTREEIHKVKSISDLWVLVKSKKKA